MGRCQLVQVVVSAKGSPEFSSECIPDVNWVLPAAAGHIGGVWLGGGHQRIPAVIIDGVTLYHSQDRNHFSIIHLLAFTVQFWGQVVNP